MYMTRSEKIVSILHQLTLNNVVCIYNESMRMCMSPTNGIVNIDRERKKNTLGVRKKTNNERICYSHRSMLI
jgi:hypothetical protein